MLELLFAGLCLLGAVGIVCGLWMQVKLRGNLVVYPTDVVTAVGASFAEAASMLYVCVGAFLAVVGGLGLTGFPLARLFW